MSDHTGPDGYERFCLRRASDPKAEAEDLASIYFIYQLRTPWDPEQAMPGERKDVELRRQLGEALARNPATPVPVLLELASLYPEAFFDNPALPLLLVEDPALPDKVHQEAPYAGRERLARCERWWDLIGLQPLASYYMRHLSGG